MPTVSSAAVLVPIKAFGAAKGRLSEVLGPQQRSALAQELASTVIAAADGLDVWVACRDVTVARWALGQGANVVWVGVDGLNPAVERATELLRGRYERIIVAHGDLPLARSLRFLADVEPDEVVVVTDVRHDGSNVMSIPTSCRFTFRYGPGSAAAHEVSASEAGLQFRRLTHDELSLDIDEPDDLEAMTNQ